MPETTCMPTPDDPYELYQVPHYSSLIYPFKSATTEYAPNVSVFLRSAPLPFSFPTILFLLLYAPLFSPVTLLTTKKE